MGRMLPLEVLVSAVHRGSSGRQRGHASSAACRGHQKLPEIPWVGRMTGRGGERQGLLNPLASFVPQSSAVAETSEVHKSLLPVLLVILQHGRTHRWRGRWLRSGIQRLKARSCGERGFTCALAQRTSFEDDTNQPTCASARPSARAEPWVSAPAQQPLCWVQQITAHLPLIWALINPSCYRLTEKCRPRYMENQPYWFFFIF